jgi:hypothetical protein
VLHLAGQWNASTTAVIAAALVNLSNRERLLDEAVATARRELPGVLDAQSELLPAAIPAVLF